MTGTSTFRDYAVLMTDASHAQPLEYLAQAVTTGQPTAHAVLGQDIWAYLREHPDEAAHFAGAMTGLAAVSAPLVAAHFDASPYRRIVDVGGGHGDLYVLAHVLHDWDDALAVQILRNCHRAGKPGHALAVVEMLLPEGPGDWLPFLLDLHMLVINGGRERTAGDFRALLAEADYHLERITRLPGGQNILLARA